MRLLSYLHIFILLIFIASSTTENTPVYQVVVTSNSSEEGSASPVSGEYEDGGQVTITATSKDVNIHYWLDDRVHSMEKYGQNVDEQSDEYRIGDGKPDKPWKVQLIAQGYESEPSVVKNHQPTPEPDREFYVGFWDSSDAPDDGVNIWKEYITHLDRVRGKGKMIPMISGFKPGMSDRKIRERIEYRLDALKDSDDVLFILLMDEPFLKGFSHDDYERITKIANEYDYNFGWTISDNKINSFDVYSEEPVTIGINTHLFFHQDYGAQWITNQQEFNQECDRVFRNARKKFPNADFIFVGQSFMDSDKYSRPPAESISWTNEYVQRNIDIKGVLWFEWKDRYSLTDMNIITEMHHEYMRVFNDVEEPEPEKNTLQFTAFWSDFTVPDNELKKLMTAGHTLSPNYESMMEVVEQGRMVIPAFGGFDKTDTEKQLRQRLRWYKKSFEKIGWENIQLIILMDEPYLKGFTEEQVSIIVDEAQKLYKAPVTFSFSRGGLINNEFPKALKVFGLNLYPFFKKGSPKGYSEIYNQQDFSEFFDNIVKMINEKVTNPDIFITAQVFGSDQDVGIPWRIPEPETAKWYMDSFIKHNIKGVMFWGWESGKYEGFEKHSDLQKAWELQLKRAGFGN